MASEDSPRLSVSRISLLVFGSGFCALVYQLAWLRLLRLIFGSSTPATAEVVAIFMGGIGAGSLILGPLSDRKKSPLDFYETVSERLAENGIFIQWLQDYEVVAQIVRTALATHGAVLESVEIWQTSSDLRLLASNRPISHDPVRLDGRRIEADAIEARLLWRTSRSDAATDRLTQALEEYGPWIPWDQLFLTERFRSLEAHSHPQTVRAQHDLEKYLTTAPLPLDARLQTDR